MWNSFISLYDLLVIRNNKYVPIAHLNSQRGHGEVAEPGGNPGQGAVVKDVPVDLGAGEASGEAGVRTKG